MCVCLFVYFGILKVTSFIFANILYKSWFLIFTLLALIAISCEQKRWKITKWKCQKLLFFLWIRRRMIFYLKWHILYHFRCVKKTCYFLTPCCSSIHLFSWIYSCIAWLNFCSICCFSLEYHFFWDIKGVKFMCHPQIYGQILLLLLFTVIYVFVYYHILCCLC